MKRLYKIIILFFIIFGIGIYFTIRSINSTFSSEEKVETVSATPTLINLVTKL
jgi:hypothetical protein